MKIKSIIGSIALMLGALTLVSAPAYAGECSAEDPCHTYAMVDGSGLVTNIIVCQPSVCGSGTFAGSRVVLQVVAHPETHLSQGGIFGGTDNIDKRVTESNGTFTITNNNPVVKQEVIKETPNSGVELQSSIGSGTQQSFTAADTAHTVGVITLHDKPIDQNIGATLTASEVNIETSTVVVGTEETSTVIVENIIPIVTESITFTERKTEKQVEDALENFAIIKRNMHWFRIALLKWLL
jgi:hypothetical protein